MISKRIRRDKGASSFGRLGRYLLGAKGVEDAILWRRTADYLLDVRGGGKKVAWWRITNCVSEVPGWAIREIEATQAKNKRAKGDKTYHLVVSFRADERPSRPQLEDIEDRLCAALGYGDHQRLSAVHTDTQNLHLHIAINKVHPRTLRCLEPYNDYYVRDAVCQELEEKHGLARDNRIAFPQLPGQAADMEAHPVQASLLGWIRERAGSALIETRDRGSGWQDLHAVLAHYGLEIRPRGAGLVIGVRGKPHAVKASHIDRGLSMKRLTERWGTFEPPGEGARKLKAQHHYRKAPLRWHPDTERLHAEYQQARKAALLARMEAWAQLRQNHTRYLHELKAWYVKRRQSIRQNPLLSSVEKRTTYKRLAEE